jgi:hypothetical protein
VLFVSNEAFAAVLGFFTYMMFRQYATKHRAKKDAGEHQQNITIDAKGLMDRILAENATQFHPLYPRKRTCAVQLAMSALGQERTWPLIRSPHPLG